MLRKILLFLLLLASLSGYASHLRSGEISYTPVLGMLNTYDITIIVYTNVGIQTNGNPTPDLPTLATGTFSFGDNTTNMPLIQRISGVLITPSIRKNVFTVRHTYTKMGTFIISLTAANRNYGIQNIPNSDTRALYVESMLTIGNGITQMTSPQLSFPPIGDGCLNYIYKLNPGAIDPDNDLLTFQLVKCKSSNGVDIPGYQYPNELVPGTTFTMDPKTGVIIWDKPIIQGEYNISFKIEKWRNGVLIGYVVRDMQITIAPCDNNPPLIDPIPNICVQAGTSISFKITSHDPDNDSLTFVTTGSPYLVPNSPATYTPDLTPVGTTSGTFRWNTNPSHFTKNPYQVYFSVTDYHPGASSLTDIVPIFITIVAPPVKNVNAKVYQRGFNVTWDKSVTPQIIGYNIYRKEGPSTVPFDSCTLGIPPNSGYTLAGYVNSPNTPSFIDSNNGQGLTSGYIYCYVVTAVFNGGGESIFSDPYCAPLMIPFIRVIQDTLTQCVGNTVKIDSTIIKFESADARTIYKWTTTSALQLSDPGNQVTNVTMITPGITPVKIVATSGAYNDSATIYFNVRPIPVPLIKLVDLGGMPDTVMFYNRSTYDVSSQWLFWDGTRSTSMDSVQFVFDHNGYFRTYLTVYNSLGCPDTTSILYRVTMKGLAIPNAFEPENPNAELNTFKPKALGLKTFFLGIWDLWGNLIWSTDKVNQYQEPSDGWNGNDSKGRKMPSQNYIWRMNATYVDGTVWKGVKDHFGNFHKEGTFTLLR